MTPARDPETGQFTSGSASSWQHVEQQIIQVEHQAGLNDTTGTGASADDIDSVQVEPTESGLDRGEIAEILGVLWDITTMPLGGADVDNRMAVAYRVGWEFTTNPEDGLQTLVTSNERENYSHQSQTWERGINDEDEAGVLARGAHIYKPPTRDATNGGVSGPMLGGPPAGEEWFYPRFNQGPMVDRFDDLHWTGRVTANHHNNPVGDISTEWNARVIYRVHETDDTRIGRS